LDVTINPKPTCSVSGATAVCGGTTNSYTSTVLPAGGTVTHSWSISGDGTITGPKDGPSVRVIAGASGTFTLTDNITRDGCPSQCALRVLVNPSPTCNVSGDTDVVFGSTHTYSATITPADAEASHHWTISGNGTISGPTDQPSASVTAGPEANGNSFTLTDEIVRDGCPGRCSLTVTLHPNTPKICVTREIACLLPGDVCVGFAKAASGVKNDTSCPAFCYRITVRNCGPVDLVNVTVTDDQLDLSACDFPTRLNVDDPVRECIVRGVTLCENATNTVTASGQSVFDSSAAGFARDQSSATGMVVQASIACTVRVSSPDDQDGQPDDEHVTLPADGQSHQVTYQITVTGGDASLKNVTIDDTALSGFGCTLPPPFSLAANATSNFTCSVAIDCGRIPAGGLGGAVTVTGEVDVSAGVCGRDIKGQPISARSQCRSLVECPGQPCALSVRKTACVVNNAPAVESCTGGAVALTLQYTGPAIDGPTVVRITGSAGPTVTYNLPSLHSGDILTSPGENGFSIDATAHRASKLGAQTRVDINTSYEVLHTSCSCKASPETNLKVCNPLCLDASSPDNPTGSKGPGSPLWTLMVLKDPSLGVITCPSAAGVSGASDCNTELPPPPANSTCKGKIHSLQLSYVGGGCAATQNSQGAGKVSCTTLVDDPAGSPVRIRVTDGGGGKVYLDTGSPASVELGNIVSFTGGPKLDDNFAADLVVTLFNAKDTAIERVKFKSDCSQPVKLGDLYGGLQVVGMTSHDGGTVSLGAQVNYTYEIKNNGVAALADVTVVDDVLGPIPGSPIAMLGPGETVSLMQTVLLTEPITNTVTVTGKQGTSQCSATATAAVNQSPSPPPPTARECSSAIVAFLVKYTGNDLPAGTTLSFTGSQAASVTATYSFPDGLASGTVLSLPAENDPSRPWTIDATKHGQTKLGTKTSVYFNGVLTEILHTSCSCNMNNFVPGLPACLDASSPDNPTGTKGEPSPLFTVLDFK
jgi:hypothetical protein